MTLLLDQLTKAAVRHAFSPGQSVPLLPILHLTYIQNTGMAFGLLRGLPWLFAAVSVLVAGWILREWLSGRLTNRWALRACGLILGGAVGNLIDRVGFGYVTDFIDLRVWPVFNVADSAITIGCGLLLWQAWRRPAAR
jgi:signal peptidase II